MKSIQESWKPQSFTVDRVSFISRAGFLDPYRVRHTVGLGQGLSSSCREVNTPYVATVGPDPSPLADGLVCFCLSIHMLNTAAHECFACQHHAVSPAWPFFSLRLDMGRSRTWCVLTELDRVIPLCFLHRLLCLHLGGSGDSMLWSDVLGPSCMQAAEFGIGALQEEGFWYFAFGANMTAKKLTDSRGIKPYEATNGFLQGWRLAFNHKYVFLASALPCNPALLHLLLHNAQWPAESLWHDRELDYHACPDDGTKAIANAPC